MKLITILITLMLLFSVLFVPVAYSLEEGEGPSGTLSPTTAATTATTTSTTVKNFGDVVSINAYSTSHASGYPYGLMPVPREIITGQGFTLSDGVITKNNQVYIVDMDKSAGDAVVFIPATKKQDSNQYDPIAGTSIVVDYSNAASVGTTTAAFTPAPPASATTTATTHSSLDKNIIYLDTVENVQYKLASDGTILQKAVTSETWVKSTITSDALMKKYTVIADSPILPQSTGSASTTSATPIAEQKVAMMTVTNSDGTSQQKNINVISGNNHQAIAKIDGQWYTGTFTQGVKDSKGVTSASTFVKGEVVTSDIANKLDTASAAGYKTQLSADLKNVYVVVPNKANSKEVIRYDTSYDDTTGVLTLNSGATPVGFISGSGQYKLLQEKDKDGKPLSTYTLYTSSGESQSGLSKDAQSLLSKDPAQSDLLNAIVASGNLKSLTAADLAPGAKTPIGSLQRDSDKPYVSVTDSGGNSLKQIYHDSVITLAPAVTPDYSGCKDNCPAATTTWNQIALGSKKDPLILTEFNGKVDPAGIFGSDLKPQVVGYKSDANNNFVYTVGDKSVTVDSKGNLISETFTKNTGSSAGTVLDPGASGSSNIRQVGGPDGKWELINKDKATDAQKNQVETLNTQAVPYTSQMIQSAEFSMSKTLAQNQINADAQLLSGILGGKIDPKTGKVVGGAAQSIASAYHWLQLASEISSGFSGFTSLFQGNKEIQDWKLAVDKTFNKFTISNGLVESICAKKFKQPGQQSAFVKVPGGAVIPAATVAAECSIQLDSTFNQTVYMYKMTLFVSNPQSIDKDTPLRYNVILSGDQTVNFFKVQQNLSRGQTYQLAREQSIFPSSHSYNQVCIQFDEPPEFFKGSTVCNKIACRDLRSSGYDSEAYNLDYMISQTQQMQNALALSGVTNASSIFNPDI